MPERGIVVEDVSLHPQGGQTIVTRAKRVPAVVQVRTDEVLRASGVRKLPKITLEPERIPRGDVCRSCRFGQRFGTPLVVECNGRDLIPGAGDRLLFEVVEGERVPAGRRDQQPAVFPRSCDGRQSLHPALSIRCRRV